MNIRNKGDDNFNQFNHTGEQLAREFIQFAKKTRRCIANIIKIPDIINAKNVLYELQEKNSGVIVTLGTPVIIRNYIRTIRKWNIKHTSTAFDQTLNLYEERTSRDTDNATDVRLEDLLVFEQSLSSFMLVIDSKTDSSFDPNGYAQFQTLFLKERFNILPEFCEFAKKCRAAQPKVMPESNNILYQIPENFLYEQSPSVEEAVAHTLTFIEALQTSLSRLTPCQNCSRHQSKKHALIQLKMELRSQQWRDDVQNAGNDSLLNGGILLLYANLT